MIMLDGTVADPQLSKDEKTRLVNDLKQPPADAEIHLGPICLPLFQARTSATARPLAAGTVSRSAVHRRAEGPNAEVQKLRRTGILRESHAAAPRADCPGELGQGRTEWALKGFGEFGSQLEAACKPQARLGQAPFPRVWFQANCSPHGGSAAVPGQWSSPNMADAPPPDRKDPQAEPAASLICPTARPDFSDADRPCGALDNKPEFCAARPFPSFLGPGRWGCASRDAHKMHGPPSSSDFDTDQAQFCCPTTTSRTALRVETDLRELFAAWE